MGKLHRIKRHFRKIVSQDPLPIGDHIMRRGLGRFYIGKTYSGSIYLSHYERSYKGLYKSLIAEYNKKRG